MPHTMPDSPAEAAVNIQPGWVLVLLGAVVGFTLAGTLALWAYYGTVVFSEMIAAGFAACFF
jgi:hypothetical protein